MGVSESPDNKKVNDSQGFISVFLVQFWDMSILVGQSQYRSGDSRAHETT